MLTPDHLFRAIAHADFSIHAAKIRVAGRLDARGRFVIGLVESDPPPTTPPLRSWPIRTFGLLQNGYYRILIPVGPTPALSDERHQVGFARGKVSVLRADRIDQQLGDLPGMGGSRTFWRLEWGAPVGRPKGRQKAPTKADEARLQQVKDGIKQWVQTQASPPQIKDVMMLIGWHRSPKGMWELLHLFRLGPWDEFVQKVLLTRP
jgi:hypothetical protein